MAGPLTALHKGLCLPEIHLCSTDEKFMFMALEKALSAVGRGSPNPQVGCVLMKGGKVVSSATTEAYGGRHAERLALEQLDSPDAVKGGTAYVTLEPCSHHGKQPPCAEALIHSGIRRCVVGCLDPFPEVAGGGVAALKAAGIEVTVGVLENLVQAWHLPFLARAHKPDQGPVFFGKWAQTLDGHLAADDGSSKWITGPDARRHAHHLRLYHDAIMVGANTVLLDNPSLTCRDALIQGRQPVKVIYDPSGRLASPASELAKYQIFSQGQCLWLVGQGVKVPSLCDLPSKTLVVRLEKGRGSLSELPLLLSGQDVEAFLGRPMGSVMVEGGATLLNLMIQNRLLVGAHMFVAPCYLSGQDHRIFCAEGFPAKSCSNMPRFQTLSSQLLGQDTLIEAVF